MQNLNKEDDAMTSKEFDAQRTKRTRSTNCAKLSPKSSANKCPINRNKKDPPPVKITTTNGRRKNRATRAQRLPRPVCLFIIKAS